MWEMGEDRKGFGKIIIVLMMFSLLMPLSLVSNDARESAYAVGNVTGEGGISLEGVEIRISTMDGGWYGGGYTNETGDYEIPLGDFGNYRIEMLMDGYLNYFDEFRVVDYAGHVHSPQLKPLPEESEILEIDLYYLTRTGVEGKQVTATYQSGDERYQYSNVTDQDGRVSWDVFPAEYKVEVEDNGLRVIEEDIEVMDGTGSYNMEIGLFELPPKNSVVKGYVMNSTGVMEDTLVAVMDPNTEITNHTATDEEGFYEIGFWEGRHFLISMAEGYDSYFHSIEIGTDDTVWMNITLKEEVNAVKGKVRDPEGSPLENATVQFFTENGFPEDNSDTTDQNGDFFFRTGDREGYLVVSDGDPFEPSDLDLYFKHINITSNMELDIDMTDSDIFIMDMKIEFGNWSSFDSYSRYQFPLNNTKTIRAMIDLMVGNGDLAVSEDELSDWADMMFESDEGFLGGPFGNDTTGNITLDGLPYFLHGPGITMDSNYVPVISFNNFTGQSELDKPGVMVMESVYEREPILDPFTSHRLSLNISYKEKKDEGELSIKLPGHNDEHFIKSATSNHGIFMVDEGSISKIIIEPVEDPNEEDDIDWEWMDIEIYTTILEIEFMEYRETDHIGKELNFTVNITRDLLPENNYTFDWEIYQYPDWPDNNYTLVEKVETHDVPFLSYSFNRTGHHNVRVDVTDEVGRMRTISDQINIIVPTPTIEVDGGWNQTFNEGETITVTANLSYDPVDTIHLQWSHNTPQLDSGNSVGPMPDLLKWTPENTTFTTTLDYSGSHVIYLNLSARTLDDRWSNKTVHKEFQVDNLPPTSFDLLTTGGSRERNLEVMQGENITLKIVNIVDPADTDFDYGWSFPEGNGESYYLHTHLDPDMWESDRFIVQFVDPGNYTIDINVSDDEGWLTLTFVINVLENYTFDFDGDGLPNWYEDDNNLSANNPSDALMDHDEDGWTTLQEFENYTNPRKNDTDEDGVPDPWDEKPLDNGTLGFDTDEDGFSDWDEMEAGTDPNDPEDHPSIKEDDNNGDDTTWIWLSLILAGILILVGGVVYILAKKNQSNMEYEE